VTPDTEQDTPATAIAAAVLFKLAAAVPDAEKKKADRAAGEATARALVEGYLDARGVLDRGCYRQRTHLATRNELTWGVLLPVRGAARTGGDARAEQDLTPHGARCAGCHPDRCV